MITVTYYKVILDHMCIDVHVTGPAKIDYLSTKIAIFSSSLYHKLITIYTAKTKSVTIAEFNELFSAAYGNEIIPSEWKILAKYKLV